MIFYGYNYAIKETKVRGSLRLMSYMSSSLVFQSKELQTEPFKYNRQHYLNKLLKNCYLFSFVIIIKTKTKKN
jgi:hypothetical protein